MYSEKQLAAIAKRENNNKRKYLVVNRLQGKHIPAGPSEVFAQFGELAELIHEQYQNETLLLIGFAETATAIGAAAAVRLNACYMQTTREDIEGAEYLYFSEAHSHATEQRLVKADFDAVIEGIDRIVFIEDEVTTGNTILDIISLIERQYTKKIRFSVASLLNGMDEASQNVYRDRQIGMHYLVKTRHDSYTGIAEQYRGDGQYCIGSTAPADALYREILVSGYLNARRMVTGQSYEYACQAMFDQIETKLCMENGKSLLVLGTEEFMYPALFAAKRFEEKGNRVKCHATTRSPIAVSTEEDYPLHVRYELASLYDSGRKTYLYDIGAYDEVIIITDAACKEKKGINTLVNAVHSCGNRRISLVRWGS